MSAPGTEHEARRAVLDALAVPAGFGTEAPFPRLRPDVHRRRTADGAWFLGEAKASEGPGNLDALGVWGATSRSVATAVRPHCSCWPWPRRTSTPGN